MIKAFLFLSLFIYSSHLFSSDISKKMTSIYGNVLKLRNVIEHENCSNPKKIFADIRENIDPLGKHLFIENQGYSVAFKNFKRNLITLEESCLIKKADKSYRKSVYKGLVKSCFHCHSSDRMDRKIAPNPITGSHQEKIEMFMMSRNYSQAEMQIDSFFKKPDYQEIKKVFDFEQNLFLKIHNKPEKLISRYQKRLKENLKKPWNWKLKTWIFELENLPKYDKPKVLFSEANAFIEKRIGLFVSESEQIRLKYLLGRLHHFLHEAEKNEVPEVLYYLGSLENRLEHNFYSVDNLYLMECLDKYEKSPVGKKCYEEFMAQVNFSYTGSSGTNIPNSVKELIKELTPSP